MTVPSVVGLDLSLTSTGACWRVSPSAAPTVESWQFKASLGDWRLVEITRTARGLCEDADLVVIEDLPTHAQSAGLTGMVQGAVRCMLAGLAVPYALVAPATLKKFATDKGNADKTAMALAAYKRAGLEGRNSDEVDAWWLWVAGMTWLGEPPYALPQSQVDALGKARWPAAVAS